MVDSFYSIPFDLFLVFFYIYIYILGVVITRHGDVSFQRLYEVLIASMSIITI